MIRLFDRNETNFNHNKTILSPLSCYVIEEANGLFELEAEFPKTVNIYNGEVIKAPTPRGDQLFRVYKSLKTLKTKKVYARHIFYDLSKNFIINLNLDNVSGFTALQGVLDSAESHHQFTSTADITALSSANYTRINPIQAIIGNENSILNTWGGNLHRNNFNISIKANSLDRGYEIRLGKNLIGIEDDTDESNVKTRLYPTIDMDGNIITLPEKYVDSPYINNYVNPIIHEERITLTNEQKELPIEDIYVIMRDHCNELFNTYNIDKPVVNYKIDFVELSKTEQYKHLAILEQLDLYDIVTCKVSQLDINVKAKVIKYKYDCLKERYDGIELGSFKSISSYKTEGIVKQISEKFKATESAVDYATNVITGNRGGYIVMRRYPNGEPYEQLFMDTNDINTATNVLRINNSGLGFSQNGYNGTYGTAMTIDGHIVADYIDTGTLTSILVQSSNYVPNTSGTKINLADGTIDSKYFKSTPTKAIFSGELQAASGTFSGNLSAASGTFKGELQGVTGTFSGSVVAGSISSSTITGGNITGTTITGSTISGVNINGSIFRSNFDELDPNEAYMLLSSASLNFYADGGSLFLNVSHSGIRGYGQYAQGRRNLFINPSRSELEVGSIYTDYLTVGGNTVITTGNISSQSVNYASNSGNSQYLRNIVYVSANNNLRPIVSGMSSCGTSDGLWTSIWSSSGTINTSDARKKNSIQDLDPRYEVLFDNINPRMFKMNDGTSDRFHVGFISQEIEQAMKLSEITSQEFAGLVKDPVYSKKLIDEDGNELDDYDTTSEIIDYDYFLRYNEFIPLLFNKVKIQQQTIDNLSNKINELEQRFAKLEIA